MASHADMDDDDIYPENDSYEPQESRMQDIDDEEEGEEVESDSDDDINFITDAKDEPKAAPDSQKSLRPGSQANERERASIRPSPTPTPAIKRELTPQANIHQISASQNDSRPGTDYPARHTSTLDPLNGNPIHSSTSKPILETDLDNDFPSESSKPWRKPGADMSDYFNYGFDEFTWASYCLKKQNMPKEIKQIGSEAEQLKAFMDGMPSSGMPGMPAMPTGPAQGLTAGSGAPDMPGMPGPAEMQQMMEFMKMQGMDPMQMDPSQMASMMMGMGGPGMQQPQQPPAGPAGFSGGHQDGFVGRGRGRRGGRW